MVYVLLEPIWILRLRDSFQLFYAVSSCPQKSNSELDWDFLCKEEHNDLKDYSSPTNVWIMLAGSN